MISESCQDQLMLAAADARSYLFTASQIIPTLLVALYVLDRRISIPYEAEVEDLDRSIKKSEESRDELEVEARAQTLRLFGVSLRLYEVQRIIAEAGVELDAELSVRLDETKRIYLSMISDVATMADRLSFAKNQIADHFARLAKVRKRMQNAQSAYRLQVAGITVCATVAEGVALLGGVGVVDLKSAAVATLDAIGLTLLILILFVFGRLFPGSDEGAWERRIAALFRVILAATFFLFITRVGMLKVK